MNLQWYYFAMLSALFSASAAILEKKTLFKERALEFSTLLAIFNIVLSLPFLFTINFANLNNPALLVLFGKSILGMFAFLFIMHGIRNLEISGALPLLVITPGLVAFFAFIFLKETLSTWQTVGLILLLIGTYVLQLVHTKDLLAPFKLFGKSKGHRYLLGALIIFTVTSLVDKWLLRDFKLPPYTMLTFQHFFIGINFLILFFIVRKSPKSLLQTAKNSWKLILLISLFTIIYRTSHIFAVKAGSVALVLALKRISVFFAVVIGGQLFKEHYLLRKTIATLIMLGGAALIILL
ncbi:MAG: EamA family transporter [Candidatus Cloacimonetes bacterium]|nr:EamA family transporter [Candidatus Cloacimonadota bacterium]